MILLINPNATEAMTNAMVAAARRTCPGMEIKGLTNTRGPAAIQGEADGAAAVPPMLELVREARGARAIILGCADDTGLAEARQIADCPVIGIGQAAYHLAALTGRFSVVTTLAVSCPILEANARAYGLGGSLARVRASGVPVLELERDPESSAPRVIAELRRAVAEDGAKAVVLACGGMVAVLAAVRAVSPVPVIDGVEAATMAASMLGKV